MTREDDVQRDATLARALREAAAAVTGHAEQMDASTGLLEASLALMDPGAERTRDLAEVLDRARIHQCYLRELSQQLARLAVVAAHRWSVDQEREFLIYCHAVKDQLVAQQIFGYRMLRSIDDRRTASGG